MIFDCFIFNNEWDILEIRFEELYPVVDRFWVVEADKTLSGRDKPVHFAKEGYSRFSQYADKLCSLTFIMPELDNAWLREEFQRNMIAGAVRSLSPDDTVLISDADEIPRRSTVEALDGTPVSLVMDKFQYSLNALTQERHGSTKAVPRSMLDSYTAHNIRKQTIEPYIQNAGWEFSSFGTPEQIQSKLQSFSHTEFDVPGISDLESIARRMAAREDVIGRDEPLTIVPVDDTWPEAVKADPERWKDYIW